MKFSIVGRTQRDLARRFPGFRVGLPATAAVCWALLSAVLLTAAPAATAAERLVWLDNYTQAQKAAIREGKFLCLVFEEAGSGPVADFTRLSSDATLVRLASRHVLARLPKDASIRVDGQPVVLLKHAAFREMHGNAGVAILDYTNKSSPHYGQVVSVYPRSKVPLQHLREMLSLPAGSLTQRTLILAVRMHVENPQSTEGEFHPVLAGEAEQHSQYQARIANQGHHQFDSRFHRINGRLPGGLMVQEVVAESWPGQGLFEAALECVASWRQSAGHWGAVRSRHPVFGYDMKRGLNRVWYATGLFARH